MEKVFHTLEPVFDENSRVLILGTMPSPKSRERMMYYGHPQNRFWRVMASVLETDLQDGADARFQMLRERGIALWDVLSSCSIDGASDSSIRDAVPNDISLITGRTDIRMVFTTGKKAYELYNRYMRPVTGIDAVCLPSPSPANCAVSMDELIDSYKQILDYLE